VQVPRQRRREEHALQQHAFAVVPQGAVMDRWLTEFGDARPRCIYVGDDERDCLAAFNAGCGMVFVTDDGVKSSLSESLKPYFSANSLLDVFEEIKNVYQGWESIV
jgi:phosphoglycolate phosphatase-like HAD superfamily hydrolase